MLTEVAKIPTRGSAQAAGRDLYSALGENPEIVIPPGETVAVSTNIATAIPNGMVGLVFARRGLSLKKGLCLANGVDVINSDYRGEWKVLIHNISKNPQYISNGEKIAQVVFVKYKDVVFYPVKELDNTGRGEGGFGSTGEK